MSRPRIRKHSMSLNRPGVRARSSDRIRAVGWLESNSTKEMTVAREEESANARKQPPVTAGSEVLRA